MERIGKTLLPDRQRLERSSELLEQDQRLATAHRKYLARKKQALSKLGKRLKRRGKIAKEKKQLIIDYAWEFQRKAKWETALKTVQTLKGPKVEELRTAALEAIEAEEWWKQRKETFHMAETAFREDRLADAEKSLNEIPHHPGVADLKAKIATRRAQLVQIEKERVRKAAFDLGEAELAAGHLEAARTAIEGYKDPEFNTLRSEIRLAMRVREKETVLEQIYLQGLAALERDDLNSAEDFALRASKHPEGP
jgi:hypothetical protein